MGLQIRVVVVSVVVAALVLVAAIFGAVAERANSKSYVGYDGTHCVYRKTAALGCGIAAALFLIAGQALLGAASGCFGRYGEARTRPMSARKRRIVNIIYGMYWGLAAFTTILFLYGAWQNAGGTSRPRRGRYHSKRGCRGGLKHGVFSSAAASSALAFFFGIFAYVYQEMDELDQPQGVAMGQQPPVFQPQQAYHQQAYPAMGYPAAAGPPPPYGGYGAKAPAAAGTSAYY